MEAKLLTQKNPFSINFFQRFRDLKSLFIAFIILNLMGLPLAMFAACMTIIREESENQAYGDILLYTGFIVIACGCTFFAMMLGIKVVNEIFHYLHNKTKVDMIYALPITNRQRFLSDLSAIFGIYIAPFLASSILAFIIYKLFYVSSKVLQNAPDLTVSYFQLVGIALMFMLLLIAFTIFVQTICGAKMESGSGIFLLSSAVPVLLATIGFRFFNNLYGIPNNEIVLKLLKYSGPISPIFLLLHAETNNMYYSEDEMIEQYGLFQNAFYWKWMLVSFLIVTILLVVSWFLYKNRKVEDVSKPYVYRFLYYFYQFTIFLTFYAIGTSLNEDYKSMEIPILFTATIIFFIFEVITNRGFTTFYKSVIRYVATFACVILFSFIINATHGFGSVRYVPTEKEVEKVNITYCGMDLQSANTQIYHNYRNYEYQSESYTFSDLAKIFNYNEGFEVEVTDPDLIKNVIEVHKECANRKDQSIDLAQDDDAILDDTLSTDTPLFYFSINYSLKSGRSVSRKYYISYNQYRKLDGVVFTEAYRKCIAQFINQQLNGRDYITKGYASPASCWDNNLQMIYLDSIALNQAYLKDMNNMTLDTYLHDNTYCYLSSDYSYSLPVRQSFTNTIAYLMECGYEPISDTDFCYSLTDSSAYSNLNEYYYGKDDDNDYGCKIVLFDKDNFKSFGNSDFTTTMDAFTIKNPDAGLELTEAQFSELVPYLRSNYISEQSCHVVIIGTNVLVVTPEGEDIVNQILKVQ